MMRRALGRGASGQSFFFDSFAVTPLYVFGCRKLSSNASNRAFRLRNATNSVLLDVFFNADGSLTGSSATDNIVFPTLLDAISGGVDFVTEWPEQMSSGSIIATPASFNVRLQSDVNGNYYTFVANNNSALMQFAATITPQPVTVVCLFRANTSATINRNLWQFRNAADTANVATHQSHFNTTFGSVTFGTARTITHNLTTQPFVIQYTGDGASGNVWVDNGAKNPANMGTNGIEGNIRFCCQSQLYSDFIVLASTLSQIERTALYDELNNYYTM